MLTCILPISPVDSILLATLTVLPQISYWGLLPPTTPATTEPRDRPTLRENTWWVSQLSSARSNYKKQPEMIPCWFDPIRASVGEQILSRLLRSAAPERSKMRDESWEMREAVVLSRVKAPWPQPRASGRPPPCSCCRWSWSSPPGWTLAWRATGMLEVTIFTRPGQARAGQGRPGARQLQLLR